MMRFILINDIITIGDESMIRTRLIEKIKNDDDIVNKDELIDYISNHILQRVYILNEQESDNLIKIFKDYDCNLGKFSKLLDCGYWIRNAVVKTGKYRTRPIVDFFVTVKNVFDTLDMDVETYNTRFTPGIIAMSKFIYSIKCTNGLINEEANCLDIAKKILTEYYIEEDNNKAASKVITILNKVNKGFREIEDKYTGVVTSEEFYSLFEVTDKIVGLYFSDIIKEFYPKFKNDLFICIKEFVESKNDEEIRTEDVIKYLRNLQETQINFESCKKDLKEEILKIDLSVKDNVEKAFKTLLDSVKYNDSISESVKKKIINNITEVFEEYSKKQDEFLDEQLQEFFNNCLEYVTSLVSNQNDENLNMNEVIAILLEKSKNAFVEYDAKKLKSIINFIMENTNISLEELKEVGQKCSNIFKDSDVEKLKSIKNSLISFKDHVNDKFGKGTVDDNLFELILANNPEFLLRDNNIDEIIGLLTGEISFKMYGYNGEEVSLNEDFLSFDFYKRLMDDNYSLLFNGGLQSMASNLNYLSMVCKKSDINMKFLKINEDFLYSLLNDSLYQDGTDVVCGLKDVIGSDNVQFLLENNPQLLMLKKEHLNVIAKRSLLNCNESYDFYDLFLSELYRYKKSDFEDLSKAATRPFKYYDLGIDTGEFSFDVEEILTSGIIDDADISSLEKQYKQRTTKIKKLEKLLESVSKEKDFDENVNVNFKNTMNLYRELYSQVPNIELKNKLFLVLDIKKTKLEQKITDLDETIEEKEKVINAYNSEIQDGELINNELTSMLEKVNSVAVKSDINEIIKKLRTKRILENKKKIQEGVVFINETKKERDQLGKIIDMLNLSFCQIDFLDDDEIDREYVDKKSFCLNDAIKNKQENANDEIALKHNVVVFADSVNLQTKDLLDDRDCVDKLNKFLVDPKFSIRSISYMTDSSLNADGIEKYRDQREKLWSRRESRTPVRVYYIPVHTKYYTVYYVVNVQKDNVHMNGGMSDSVYKHHVSESEKILEMVNGFTKEEAMAYIRKADANYDEKVKPITDKKNKK